MKLRTKCKNGNTVVRFYDIVTRSSVTQVIDPDGNQVGDSEYDGNKDSAAFSWHALVRHNGGEAD